MAFRNPLTNMFMPASEKWVAEIAKVDSQFAENAAEDARTTAALAEALAADVPDADLIAALRQKRHTLAEGRDELGAVRATYVVKREEAQAKEYEAEHAAELAARKKAAQTRKQSVAQHVGEIRRCLGPIPEHLAAIHKAVASAEQEIEKAELIVGGPFVGIDGVASLLRRAIKAAALEDWFRQPVYETDQSPVEALAVELDARLDAAIESFDYTLGLKTYEPDPAAIAEQDRRQAEQERVAAASEEHQRRLATDPAYLQSMFPETGVAFVAPGTEEAARVRRSVERHDAELTRRLKSEGM